MSCFVSLCLSHQLGGYFVQSATKRSSTLKTRCYASRADRAEQKLRAPVRSQVRIGEWWTWYTPIRTALERPFNFRIYLGKTHEYQRISAKAKQLRAKGLSWSEIGRKLKVTGKTAKKAATKGEL
jgi:hypothetical protein